MQCPELFSPINANGCVYDCTQHAMFTLNTEGGQGKCVYRFDGTKKVTLNPLNAIPINGMDTSIPTMQSLQANDAQRYTLYSTELTRVNTALQQIVNTIDHDTRVADAFQALQMAEETRGTDPDAYQLARNTYYTLTKGDGWIDTERQRLLDSEIDPELDRYRSEYELAAKQKVEQQQTLDIVTAVKDRVLSMKDDFEYSTSMFKTQLDKLKSQLNIERRGRTATTSSESTTVFYRWFDTVLNLLIAIAVVYGGMTLWSKYSARQEARWTTYTLTPAKA
jgi:hypothetical protein